MVYLTLFRIIEISITTLFRNYTRLSSTLIRTKVEYSPRNRASLARHFARVLDFCPRAPIDSIVLARSGRVLSRVGVESWLRDPDANRPRGTVALPTSMKGVRMDNFSVRSERNFHNLAAKPKRIHLLDKPNGYASALVKSSLSHQMRFTVEKLEEELCVAGDPHVLQIKLLGDDSREPSSWKLFADGACAADGSGPLPASASTRGPKCSWTCAKMPCARRRHTSGVRGSTNC